MATGDKYVMNGVWLTCDKGVAPSRFNVTPKPVQLYDEHFANELDKIPLVNILPFGVCSVTRTPCMPAPVMWERVMEDGLTVLGARPLVDTSKCQCGVGGQIAIHFTKADASAAVELDQQLDKVDEVADAAETASTWAFWGGIGLAVGGAILCATGVGAPLGAAMIVAGEVLVDTSAVLAVGAAVAKGATKFARDPSLQNGLSIVGEVLVNIAVNYVMNKVGGKFIEKLGAWAQKGMNKLGLSERACGLANRLLCTVTGHPVDVINGYLYTEAKDFEFTGPIPLRWERLWNSTSIYDGPLGHGWHHSYDLALVVEADQQLAALRGADGRGIAFDLAPLGELSYNRLEKMSLLHDERGYAVLDHGQGLTYRFGPARPDGVQALAAVENANGFAITFIYDERSHLAGIVDSAQRQFQVNCDEQGRILTIVTAHPTEPRQTVVLVTYAYNAQGELVGVTDALGQVVAYQYQNRLLTQETLKTGLNFYFEFAGSGPEARCIRTWGDEGIYDHSLLYDLEVRRTVVTNSLGYTTTYFGNENGLVMEKHDARGGVTSTEYNEFNERLREVNPLGHSTAYAYDERGNYLAISATDGTREQYAYDEHDRLIALTDAVGGCWQWAYNEVGQLATRTNPLGQAEQYAYQDGLLVRIGLPGQHATELTYDAACNLSEYRQPEGLPPRWLYDGWGRVRKFADARGNVQWREYDLLGRLITVHEPDGNVRRFAYDALNNVVRAQDRHQDVQYAYRGLGRLIRRAEAGTAVEFLYDAEEQLRALVNEHGLTYRFELDGEGDVITETGFDGLSRQYQRDAGGRVLAMELPNGQRVQYEYDPMGRTTQVRYGDGKRETYAYRPDGLLCATANDTISVSFVHDVLGNVLSETQGTHTVTSEYNLHSQRVGLASSLGAAVQYTRDEAGRVAQVQAGNWQAVMAHDAQGLELHRDLSGGVRAHWKRDNFGRPTAQQVSTGRGRPDRTRAYTWQAADRLTDIQDSHQGSTHFERDTLGNLAAASFGDSRQLRLPDAVGNLFTTAARLDRRYGPAGQLQEAKGNRYTYDELGNLTGKTLPDGRQWQYSWTSAGQLAEVVRPDGNIVRFAYDALGRRVSKHFRGQVTRWVWDGNVPLHEWIEPDRELTAGHSPAELVTWLFEETSFAPTARLTAAGSQSVVCDHLGTPLALYDERGEPTWEAQLDSYGAVRHGRGQAQDCPFRYQGQYEDVETGLYYNRFRYYDPEAGQYISQDPIRLKGGISLYAYAADTTAMVDSLGLSGYVLGQNLLKNTQTHGINPFNRTADWQAHHLIPEEVWGQNKQFFKDIGVRGRDNARNGIFLPNSAPLGNQHSFDYYHSSNHPTYSANVSRQLSSIETDFRNGTLNKLQAKQEVEALQHTLRNQLNGRTNGTGCRRLT